VKFGSFWGEISIFAAQKRQKMASGTALLLCFSANLAFIVTNLYGWLLKRFYIPTPFKEHFHELYPAQKAVATLYLLQLFELPYLFHIGQAEALFYINGTSVLFFSSYMLVLVKGYFFLEYPTPKQLFLFMLPVVVCWLVLLLPVFGVIPFSDNFQTVMFVVVTVVAAIYVGLLIKFRNQLHRHIHKLDEDEYSNESDFPLLFAKKIQWLPLAICLLMYSCFVLNHPTAKLVRDLVFIVVNVWFAIYTLNPHRSLRPVLNKVLPELTQVMKEEKAEETVEHADKYHLTEEQCKEMETRLLDLLRNEKLYLEDHLTMSDLTQRMHTNKNYLGEVIARSEYESFYKLINTLRIEHACQLLDADPSLKMEQVGFESGFSSGSAFSQVFKRMKGVSPSEYLRGS
jgi:AraC-like DNA-binding protein